MSKPNTECPRCLGGIPNSEHPGAYPGALSRWDNATEVCSACGLDEAMIQLAGGSIAPDGPHPWKRKPATT